MLAEQLDKILKDHKLWLESVGDTGKSADLRGADLRGADLRGADLRGADLNSADLNFAHLNSADLRGADLRGADLRGADLNCADLRGAHLNSADLRGADLNCADLRGADLNCADLRGAALPEYKLFPEEGSFIAWKKLTQGYLAKIMIPEDALRCSNLISRKGRSNKIKILQIYDREGDIYTGKDQIKCWSNDYNDTYLAGNTYETELDADIRIDCTKGFHFFLTKEEALAW